MKNNVFGDIEFVTQIGRGTYADIWKVYNRVYDSFFVAKIDRLSNEETKDEYRLQEKVNHPLVCQYYDSQIVEGRRVGILEYIDGDNLLAKVNSRGLFSEREARFLTIQLVSILMHLHNDLNMIHRDIKCENIIVDSFGNARLIDFGFAICYDELVDDMPIRVICGSPEYMAPEIIKKEKQTTAVDIWSLGVVIHAITTGMLPFDKIPHDELFEQILTQELEYSFRISPELNDLLGKMLDKDKNKRITLPEIIAHPWITVMAANGDTVSPNMGIFDKLSILPKSDEEVDKRALSAIISQFDANIAIEHIKKHKNSPETILYKLFRRRSIWSQLIDLKTSLFSSVPASLLSAQSSVKDYSLGKSFIIGPYTPQTPPKSSIKKIPTFTSVQQKFPKIKIFSPSTNQSHNLISRKIVGQPRRGKVRHNSSFF